jgi:hypothetical protein
MDELQVHDVMAVIRCPICLAGRLERVQRNPDRAVSECVNLHLKVVRINTSDELVVDVDLIEWLTAAVSDEDLSAAITELDQVIKRRLIKTDAAR